MVDPAALAVLLGPYNENQAGMEAPKYRRRYMTWLLDYTMYPTGNSQG